MATVPAATKIVAIIAIAIFFMVLLLELLYLKRSRLRVATSCVYYTGFLSTSGNLFVPTICRGGLYQYPALSDIINICDLVLAPEEIAYPCFLSLVLVLWFLRFYRYLLFAIRLFMRVRPLILFSAGGRILSDNSVLIIW